MEVAEGQGDKNISFFRKSCFSSKWAGCQNPHSLTTPLSGPQLLSQAGGSQTIWAPGQYQSLCALDLEQLGAHLGQLGPSSQNNAFLGPWRQSSRIERKPMILKFVINIFQNTFESIQVGLYGCNLQSDHRPADKCSLSGIVEAVF